MKHRFYTLSTLAVLFMMYSTAHALSLDFVKRGFKSCTETCNDHLICSLENDEVFKWCLKNCAYKIDVKTLCETTTPYKLRPILPYETYTGIFNTNQISIIALENLDRRFIEQTTDRRRVVGTAKLILLVRAQLVDGTNIQKLNGTQREALGDKLFKTYFKNVPSVLNEYQKTGIISDDKLNLLIKEVKSEIFLKIK